MAGATNVTGRIIRLHRRGYGFIRADLVDQQVFFPAWAVDKGFGYTFDDLRPGHVVEFSLVFDEAGRPQAQHVTLLHSQNCNPQLFLID